MPKVLLANPMDLANILNAYRGTAMPNTVYAQGEGAIAKIGYSSIKVQTMLGPLDVISDRFQKKGYIRLVDPDSFVLLSSGELVRFLEVDEKGGFFRLTPAGEDSSEFTLVAQWQMGCNAPGNNAIIKIA